MKAWVLRDIGEFHIEEREMKKPAADEVLIRVKSAGICGSDIPRVYRDGAHHMPLVIGHEFAGEVVETGSSVSKQWQGKRTGIFPLIPCFSCGPCKSGQYEMCRGYDYLGSRRDGGFAEYVTVPAWNLLELPDNVTFSQAAMFEPMAVAAHALRRLDPDKEGSVAVFGQGTIGLLLLMLLLAEGFKDICVFGNHDIQRAEAEKLGLPSDRFCDTRQEDPEKWVSKRTDKQGFDACFEAVGTNDNLNRAIALTTPGGRICILGNPASDMLLRRDLYWKILRNQLTLTGTWNSSFKGGRRDDWVYISALLQAERIRPETLITHRLCLKELERGFLIMRDKSEDYTKIMMEIPA